MNSPPQKSGTEGPKPEKTDLASLMSEPVPAPLERRKKQEAPTDFASLKKSLGDNFKRIQHRSVTDWIVDVLTPLLIFVMVLTVVLFLLSVRLIFTENFHRNLQFVSICFVIGIVALNRLIATEGGEESILYVIAMVGAAGMYTMGMTSMWGGSSIAGSFLDNPWVASFFNMGLVAILWLTTNRLMHECCIDEKPAAGDIGILTGTAEQVQKAVKRDKASAAEGQRRRRRGKGMIEHMELEAIDPTEWKKPKDTGPKKPVALVKNLPRSHPGISIIFFSVPVMIIFALGQRALLAAGHLMDVIGLRYALIYTASALALLMLTSLGGLREYFRARHVRIPAGLGPFWIGLGTVMLVAVIFGALAMPLPPNPKAAQIEHEYDSYSRSQILPPFVEPDISAAEAIRNMKYIDRVGKGVLICFAVLLVYGLLRLLGAYAASVGRHRDLYPDFVVRFFNRIDRLLQRFISVPTITRRKGPRLRRISRNVATCAKCVNPMADAEQSANMTVAQHIELTYDALCALALDLGVPRDPDVTPNEFIASFPDALKPLKDEAAELTTLYVASAYSPQEFDQRIFDSLRRFWITYERVRNLVLS